MTDTEKEQLLEILNSRFRNESSAFAYAASNPRAIASLMTVSDTVTFNSRTPFLRRLR
jgi:hypothetical protein